MSRALKGRMPRLFGDCRCTDNRRLREVFEDLAERFALETGLARRLATIAARAWLDYEAVTRDLEGKHKPLTVRRLVRRQRAALGQFHDGLRQLEAMCQVKTLGPGNLADALRQEAPRV